MSEFVHLHVHTEYSLLDGACRLGRLVRRAKELDMPALATTDHGALYGAAEFYTECKNAGIKPIIGCEVNIANGASPYHLTLLCMNDEGYRNLCRIVSGSAEKGLSGVPLTSPELLKRHNGGLIALSGCENGEIFRTLSGQRYEAAASAVKRYSEIFNGRFYLEAMHHGTDTEQSVLPQLRRLSSELSIPICPTNDVHYINKSDSRIQRVLSCIGQNKKLSDPNPAALPTDEYYLKSYDEMRRFFSPEELAVTIEIAERCNFNFEFGVTKLPLYTAEGVTDNAAYFRRLVHKGAEKRYGEISADINERLDYELSVIEKMGFVDYFLIVWDFIRYARSQNIPVGPGRGSGAGSLCAYCMGITDIDPIRYQLLFERFLNPERVSMPDFDIDFCNERRGEVIEYVRRRYGADHVAQIAAFDTLKAKAALRDTARVLGIAPSAANTAARLISSFNSTLSEEAEKGELAKLCAQDDEIRRLVATAKEIEGMPRHTTIHAAGVVITREPVSEYAPLDITGGETVTQYPAPVLEKLGLLKMDFLGLRNLTVIKRAEELIQQKKTDFNINQINETDPEVFRMLSNGGTSGVFQFESGGMTSVLSRLKPESIEDLTAALALYRPGPMASIPVYIENKNKPDSEITYRHEKLRGILSVTHGVIVYQEQVMQICREIGGYSYGRADIVRRAMSKKKQDVMVKERAAFVYGTETNCGAIKNGVPENIANEIFDDMMSFASYAFNKSHAAAYSKVAYQTAYLRKHYYLEYMTVLISSVLDWTEKTVEYIGNLSANGIKLLPPDINKSFAGFSVENGNVRFGLLGVKNLGRNFINSIISERNNGKFKSLPDFCTRMAAYDNNRRYMEALIKSGAMSAFPQNRRQMLLNSEKLLDMAQDEYSQASSGQLNLFGESGSSAEDFIFPNEQDFTPQQLLSFEKEMTGLYISGHPADSFVENAPADCGYIASFGNIPEGRVIATIGLVTSRKNHTAKNGKMMSFLTLEDSTGETEVIVFPETYENFRHLLIEGEVLCIWGKISRKDEYPKLIADNIVKAETLPPRNQRTLFINMRSDDATRLFEVNKLLLQYQGMENVRICYMETRSVTKPLNIRGVRICTELTSKLAKICGNSNIIVK